VISTFFKLIRSHRLKPVPLASAEGGTGFSLWRIASGTGFSLCFLLCALMTGCALINPSTRTAFDYLAPPRNSCDVMWAKSGMPQDQVQIIVACADETGHTTYFTPGTPAGSSIFNTFFGDLASGITPVIPIPGVPF